MKANFLSLGCRRRLRVSGENELKVDPEPLLDVRRLKEHVSGENELKEYHHWLLPHEAHVVSGENELKVHRRSLSRFHPYPVSGENELKVNVLRTYSKRAPAGIRRE